MNVASSSTANSTSNNRPAVRADLRSLDGYHSPQLDVQVRLNTNESALPPPPEFTRALADAISQIDWNRYPDRAAQSLREEIAACHPGVEPEQIFVANGSNEVLQTLFLTFGSADLPVATFEPTYAMYSQIARTVHCGLVEVERDAQYQITTKSIDELVAQTKPNLLVLCSPNNPTGTSERLTTIAHALDAAANAVVVVDEAYGQFSASSALELLAGPAVPASTARPASPAVPVNAAAAERLVITRTFSKTWAMAGLRLGYCIAPEWMVKKLQDVVLPYHLDSFKLLAGRLALNHRAEMEQRIAQVVAERKRVSAGLAELGFDVTPSQANFVLFNTASVDRSGDEIWQALVDQSVLVRNCSSWPRLANCLRATIGTSEENDRFLAAAANALVS